MRFDSVVLMLAGCLLATGARATTAPGNDLWWWNDAWWEEGRLEVPQNHAVETTWTSYPSGDVDVPALVARPAGPGKYPAVLFVHGRRGLDELIQRHARRLAARGLLFHGS